MSILMNVVHKLAVEIGPRPPGSAEEREAARFLDRFFNEKGLTSEVTSFRSLRTFSLTYGIFYTLSIASVALFPWRPWIALGIAAVNVLLFVAEINTRRIFGSLFDAWRSRNVIGRKWASGRSKRSLVLSAHIDSSRSGLLFTPPVVYLFRPIFLSGLVSLFLIPLLLGAALVTGIDYLWIGAILPALFLTSGILLLLQRETKGCYTAGANDNASAVAVLAGLAEHFAGEPAENCDIWFVGTGSEESGIIGMTDFLKRYRGELKDPLFINLESLGCGELYYLEREGMFPVLKSDPCLVKMAGETAAEHKLPFSPGRFHVILTDNVAVLSRKLPGITIMGCGERGLIPHWHQHSDVVENVSEDNLQKALKLVQELIRKIDRAAEQAPGLEKIG